MEASLIHSFHELKRHKPSVMYLPHMDVWWRTVPELVRSTFVNLLSDLNPHDSILLLATADDCLDNLDEDLVALFRTGLTITSLNISPSNIIEIRSPTNVKRIIFLVSHWTLMFSLTLHL